MRSIIAFTITILLVLSLSATKVHSQTDWYMAGANPQRTSWVTGPGTEIPGKVKALWYRPLDPYVEDRVQLVASDNKIFVASSKGLYAFDAENGSQLWVYGTQMPLSHSPTYHNGTVYVGGFDHKIHAVNASDGTPKSNWVFYEAGAGFDANPLVIQDTHTNNQPVVFAGNRDGYFYALDGNTGALKWRYQTSGPILLSAAYKDGIVYFASMDSHAYALNSGNGNLVWKSEKFPGVGFDMYWPVIFTDKYPSSPTYGQDFVILAGSLKASRWQCGPGYSCQIHTPNFEMYQNVTTPLCGPAGGSEKYLWIDGAETIKCDVIFNYYNNNPKWGNEKPWWRVTYILNRQTGIEHPIFAPVNPCGFDGDGQGFKQPPIVSPEGVIYNRIGYGSAGNGGASGWIAGWKFGTPYLQYLWDDNPACDEPAAFTGGGGMIYWGEGSFNHETFGTIDTTKPGKNNVWQWGEFAWLPGATTKYGSLTLGGDAKFGSFSGAYAYMDGITNFSPIPYKGKLYLINGNVLYALSPSGTAQSPLATAQIPTQQKAAGVTLTKDDIELRLYHELQKMLQAGHLRPGYLSSGLVSQWMEGAYSDPIPGHSLTQYFINPADTVRTLLLVVDYLDSHPENTQLQSLRSPLLNYVQTNYGPGAPYSFTQYASIGWRNGAQRELYDDLPEFKEVLADNYEPNFSVANTPRECIWAYYNLKIATPNTANCWLNEQAKSGFPPDSFYAAWKYAQRYPGTAGQIFTAMRNKLSTPGVGNDMTDANLVKYPYLLNQYIIGYRGYVELDRLANNLSAISQSSKYAEYQRLLNLRWTTYSKDPNFTVNENIFNGQLNAARNFMYLTPELGSLMRSNVLTQVQATVDQYEILTPMWFVSKSSGPGVEGYHQPLYDYPALFQARAYILQQPFEDLVQYIDVPAFERGDLFYIQNLVAALEAPQDPNYTPHPTPPPSSPTSTPSYSLDSDTDIDIYDILILISRFTHNLAGDFNQNGRIDIFDLNTLIKNL